MEHRNLNAHFAAYMRHLRKIRNMSAVEFADYLGIGKTTVLNIEHDKANVTLDIVENAAQRLNVPAASLLRESDPAETSSTQIIMNCLSHIYHLSPNAMEEMCFHLTAIVGICFTEFLAQQKAAQEAAPTPEEKRRDD